MNGAVSIHCIEKTVKIRRNMANESTAGDSGKESSIEPSNDDYGDYPPGTIVLAKLKSFPPWPAIVIPDDLVPEGVASSKPKKPASSSGARSSRASRSRRKSTAAQSQTSQQDSRLWCVRFLRDDTFMWATANDISLLTKEQIEKFLSKNPKKGIRSAYEMALDPPEVEEFIIYGSDGKPIDIDNEADDADFEDGESTPDDDDEDAIEEEGLEEDDDDVELLTDEEVETKRTSKRTRKTTKSTPRKKAKPAPAKKKATKRGGSKAKVVEEPETSSDEDWDAPDDDSEPVAVDILTSEEISKIIKKTTPLFLKARLALQSTFLSGKEITDNLKQINTTLDSLEKSEHPHVGIIKATGLHKVIFDILKRPDLTTRELSKVRSRLEKLAKEWFDVTIDVEESWNFEEPNEESKDEESEVKKEETGASDIKEETESTNNHPTNGSTTKAEE